jgi:1-acyl-sn-glycerol-3-phosphate acyltransferase
LQYDLSIMFKKILLSLAIWAVGFTLTVILFLVMLFFTVILFPFDIKRKVPHSQCYWWADAITCINPYWAIEASGLENIDRNKTYVIVANHRSLGDIVVIYKTKMQFKWVAKDSLFRLPVLGWCMTLARHIRLSRGEFGSIKKVYKEAAKWLRGGMSVLFFPEGTRSETDRMRDFQNGAFKLAIKERMPVLPMSIRGTGNAIPKGSWLFTTKVRASLKVLPPIETAAYDPGEFAKLRDLARNMMESA